MFTTGGSSVYRYAGWAVKWEQEDTAGRAWESRGNEEEVWHCCPHLATGPKGKVVWNTREDVLKDA